MITRVRYILWAFLSSCMKCRRGLAMRILSVRPSVCPSVKRVICDKTKEWCVQSFIPYERLLTLVFWEEEWLVRGDPFYLSIFQQQLSPGWQTTQNIANFSNQQISSNIIRPTTAVASPYSRSLYGNIILFKILKYTTSNSLSFKSQLSIVITSKSSF